MSDNPTCECGHAMDEHRENDCGDPADCGVEGCGCVYFESTEDEE